MRCNCERALQARGRVENGRTALLLTCSWWRMKVALEPSNQVKKVEGRASDNGYEHPMFGERDP